eukprot:7649999-Alexandrium_andersonii.AAC.1
MTLPPTLFGRDPCPKSVPRCSYSRPFLNLATSWIFVVRAASAALKSMWSKVMDLHRGSIA